MTKRLSIRFSMVFLIVMFLSVAAYADTFRLRIEDLDTHQGVVLTAASGTGVINFSGPLGTNFNSYFNVVSSLTHPILNNPDYAAQMNLNLTFISSTGSGTLRITLEDTDYNGGGTPDTPVRMVLNGNVGGSRQTAGAPINFQTWVNPSNQVPGLGTDTTGVATLGDIDGYRDGIPYGSTSLWPGSGANFTGTNFSAGASGDFDAGGSFALFSQATISFNGTPGELVNLSATTTSQVDRSGAGALLSETVNPEPTSLLLLGSGLASMWLGKKKKQSV